MSVRSGVWMCYAQAIKTLFYPHPQYFSCWQIQNLSLSSAEYVGSSIIDSLRPSPWMLQKVFSSCEDQDSPLLLFFPEVLNSLNRKLLIGNGF